MTSRYKESSCAQRRVRKARTLQQEIRGASLPLRRSAAVDLTMRKVRHLAHHLTHESECASVQYIPRTALKCKIRGGLVHKRGPSEQLNPLLSLSVHAEAFQPHNLSRSYLATRKRPSLCVQSLGANCNLTVLRRDVHSDCAMRLHHRVLSSRG